MSWNRRCERRASIAAPLARAAAVALAMFCGLNGATPVARAADVALPYIAYVVGDDTAVRSGPGRDHYATDKLPAGYAVEVYRHDGAGWCAIRPPQGSFCEVEARDLRIVDGGAAEVTAAQAICRVGSRLGQQRSAVQVVLNHGESVQLAEPPKPPQPWVRIAPPAGEFRWIEARRLSRTPPVEGAGAQARDASWQSPEQAQTDDSKTAPEDDEPTAADFAHLRSAADEIIVVEGSPAEVQLAQHTVDAAPSPNAASATGQPRIRFPGRPAKAPLGPLDQRVAELQLRLSAVVVEPPAAWRLSALREEAAALLAQEESAVVRDQLRDLLDRVAMFEDIQRRHASAPMSGSSAAQASTSPAALAPPPSGESAAATTGRSAEVLARARQDLGDDVTPTPERSTPMATSPPPTEALYDAVGTLKPVVSRRSQAPRFALVDDDGNVVTLVTSAHDVNLQPYLGQRIGVRGTRGFMPEYRRAHVLANRVTPLEEKLVR
ncbi:MAG: hypothetical protein IT424_01285 [Pirellulales bacterium]|nr:hypothetical protein [Pirellulales bacterium]